MGNSICIFQNVNSHIFSFLHMTEWSV